MERRLAAIMLTDMVGYSRLMGLDEEDTIARQRAHREEIIEPKVSAHGGRIVKSTGDGLLVEFASVVDAVKCAVGVQEALGGRDTDVPEDRRIQYRIGINLGDIVFDGDDILGDGVNVAARLEGLAKPGGICVSGTVYDQLAGKLDILFKDGGEQKVKNVPRPVHVWYWQANGRPDPPKKRLNNILPNADQTSIAVLPFSNMSKDWELEYQADALTEDITMLLARIPGFTVIARNSSFAYKDKSTNTREIATELDVRYVVEGSLRHMGSRMRTTVQLIDAVNGTHIWSKRFDKPADDVQDVQDEVVTGIMAELVPELTRAEFETLRRRATPDMNAWSYFQKANGILSLKGWRRETFDEAANLLSQAIKLDPELAVAHAYLALVQALGRRSGLLPANDDGESVVVASAEVAVTLDNQSSAVLGYAGCALCDVGQTLRGIDILERAIDIDPSNAQAWVALGVALIRQGKVRRGVEMLEHGIRISPLDNRAAYWSTNLANALFRLGRVDDAINAATLACRRDENLDMARVVLAMIFSELGRKKQAKDALAEALRINPDLQVDQMRVIIGRHGVQILQNSGLLPHSGM